MKILLATDGYPTARRAEGAVAVVADAARSEVDVVSVPVVGLPGPLDLGDRELRRKLATDVSTGAAERLRALGFTARALEAEGRPAPTIAAVAAEGGHDLVAVGAGGTSWLGNLLLGSVSTYLLHHAPCSVLVVHEEPGEGPDVRIVLGTDGSADARAAEEALVGLVDRARTEVVVVTVAPLPPPPAPPILGRVPAAGDGGGLQDELVEGARRTAEDAAARLTAAGARASALVKLGNATAGLLEEVRDGADLVVVGARGLGGRRPAVLGSVSDQVARHAPAALIARRKGAGR